MAFIEGAVFPTQLALGTSFGPGFHTDIARVLSGAEQATQRWEVPLYGGDVRSALTSIGDAQGGALLRRFYLALRGAANGFRFEDFFDNTSAADDIGAVSDTDQQIGTGDGSSTAFQLVKRYTESTETLVRPIEKPQTGTVVVAVDGTPTGSVSVNHATGVVTFSSAPANGAVITAGFKFHVPVRFGKAADRALRMVARGGLVGEHQAIPLTEIRNGGIQVPDGFYYGGSQPGIALSANYALVPEQGRFQRFDPQSSGLELALPDATNLPTGSPWFVLHNSSGSNALTVTDSAGADVGGVSSNLPSGQTRTVALAWDAAGTTKEWWLW